MVVDAGSGAGVRSRKSGKRPKSAAQHAQKAVPKVSLDSGPDFKDEDKQRHALIQDALVDSEINRQYIQPSPCAPEGPLESSEQHEEEDVATEEATVSEVETRTKCFPERLTFEKSRTNENWMDPRCTCDVTYSHLIDGITLKLIPLPDGLHMYHGSSFLADDEIPGSFKSHPGFRPTFFTSKQSAAGYAVSKSHNTFRNGKSPRLHEFSLQEASEQRYVIDLGDADNFFALKELLANYAVNPVAERTVPGYTATVFDFSFRCKRDDEGRVSWTRYSKSNYDPEWATGICMLIQDKKIPAIGAGARAFSKQNTFLLSGADVDEEAAFHPEIILCQPKYHLQTEGSSSIIQSTQRTQVDSD
eukprot:GILJ01000501.1.p1 GENE.GILJ01000501.1~~GILJ01000501.1.p1  ORF type:complete len:391 (-),score=53.07 GILJ01000501.1:207-1286(-)